jgi:hemoglobin
VTGESRQTIAERAGGVETFRRIVDRFYVAVESDDLLRPMYPDDLNPGKDRLARFLAQYFGAGPVYSQERGHPRLRMRHAPFPITIGAAARWAAHMTDAIIAEELPSDVEGELLEYVLHATPTLTNTLPDQVLPTEDPA